MLSEIEDEAIEHGWIVVSETATPGLISRIEAAVETSVKELGSKPKGRRVTGVTVGPVSIDTELATDQKKYWRGSLTELLSLLAHQGTGLLVSIDEIHAIDRSELAEIAAVVQHLIGEDLPIGLVMAGLPKAVEDLLNEGVATFLRRAERHDLHRTSISEVASAFRATFAGSTVEISDEHVQELAGATDGYPFLIQLVGYHVFSQSVRAGVVSDDTLTGGIRKAHRKMGATVVQSAYKSLSDIDQSYLLAMAQDDGPSSTAEIARRLGVTQVYGGQYRLRLLAAGVIEATGHGYVDFAVPTFREFLRDTPAYGMKLIDPDGDSASF